MTAKSVNLRAESYLDHLWIALRAGDRSGPIFRNFFDNWFAYDRGHPFVSKNGAGTPHWFNKPNPQKHREALLAMHFVSRSAKDIIETRAAGVLAVDHAVPVAIMRDMMFARSPVWSNAGDVRIFLETWYRVGVISQAEHETLKVLKCNHKMPANWNGRDVFARYFHAGIEPVQA